MRNARMIHCRTTPTSTLFPYTTLFRSLAGDVEVAGGVYELGADPAEPFVFDNEKWAHPVPVASFRIARAAVSQDRKSTRLNSSHGYISYAVFCLKNKIHLRLPSAWVPL